MGEAVGGTLTRTYVGNYAEISGSHPAAGTYSYYSEDNLGSIRRLRAQDKSSIGQYEYEPYRASYSASGSAISHRYSGNELGSTEDMYYTKYRYYSPNIARWINRDPAGAVDGPNLYSFVSGNPMRWIDPLGLALTSPSYPCEKLTEIEKLIDSMCKKAEKRAFMKCMCKAGGDPYETYVAGVRSACKDKDRIQLHCPKPGNQNCLDELLIPKCGSSRVTPPMIYMCKDGLDGTGGCGEMKCTVAHEIAHLGGAPGVGRKHKEADDAMQCLAADSCPRHS